MTVLETYTQELRKVQEKINILFDSTLKKMNEDDLIKLKELINESFDFDFAFIIKISNKDDIIFVIENLDCKIETLESYEIDTETQLNILNKIIC